MSRKYKFVMRRVEDKRAWRRLRGPGTRIVWDPAPTRHLLKLWLENIDDLRGAKRNTEIHRDMANKMAKYEINNIEIKAKMDNMTKTYRKEMTKYRATGEPSKWKYINEMKEILKESKAVNLSLCMNEDFDFSPMDDSESNDSTSTTLNNISLSKGRSTESEVVNSSDMSESVKSDSAFSANTHVQEPPEEKTPTKMDKILAIKEANLDIQREKLKVMKKIADDLSTIHREFLKVYKYKN